MSLVLFLGPPGSGKTSVGKEVSKKIGYTFLSMGNLFRTLAKEDSYLAHKVGSIISSGQLIDNKTTVLALQKALQRDGKKVILDGFPKKRAQVAYLHALCYKLDLKVVKIILFDLPYKIGLERLGHRKICSKCGKIYGLTILSKKSGICDNDDSALVSRKDDNAAALYKRMNNYKKKTLQVVDYYSELGLVKKVDANVPYDILCSTVLKELENLKTDD